MTVAGDAPERWTTVRDRKFGRRRCPQARMNGMSAWVDARRRGMGGLEVVEWVLLRLRGRLGRDLGTRAKIDG
jgi:hypothetical protein